jgi:hypothetical protein
VVATQGLRGAKPRVLVPVVRWSGDTRVAPFGGLARLTGGGLAPVLGNGAWIVPRPPRGRRRRSVPGGPGSTRGPPGCPAGDLLPPRPRRDRDHAVVGRAVLDSGAAGGGRGGRGLLPRSRRRVRGGMGGGDPRDFGVVRLTRCVGAPAWRPIRQALCVPVVGLGGAAGTSGRRLVPAELVDRADLAAVSVTLGSVGLPSARRRSSRAQCLSSNNIPAGASGSKLAATTYCGGRATLPGPPPQGDITAGSATTASSLGTCPAIT